MSDSEPVTYFRRREFGGGYNTRLPRWHATNSEPTNPRGSFVALCGYTYGNYYGSLLISRENPPRPKGDMCARCGRKIAPATPET